MGDNSNRWEPGRLVGDHYRVERFLDEGSGGEVYAGQNVWIGRSVALKRLQPQHHRESVLVERFMLEGRIGGRIDHPNIVQTLDMAKDPTDDSFFIVQELLQGVGLRTLLHRSARMFYRDALDLVIPLLGALVAVHQQGIVHRDIKPENIFVADSIMGHTVPKLLDFGIAKVRLAQTLTQAGSLLGTVDYMAPEQIEGLKDVDRRVDVWAVGVLTYELLTGECPFAAPNPAVSLTKIMAHHPPLAHELVPEVPPAVSAAVERAMRKSRLERHESMQQLLEELLRWSATSSEELDRALTNRHRTSLPAAVEQKMRAGVISMAPSSMRTSIMVSAHRSGQFRLPESLKELAAFMDGGEPPVPTTEPANLAGEPESQEPLDPLGEDEADRTIPPEPRASDEWEIDELIADAYSCLRKHAFAEAYRAAEDAIQRLLREPAHEEPSAGPEQHARLLLLQAEAAYWGGSYDAHEACVIRALALTDQHDRDWFRCIAELAESTSLLGVHDRLSGLVEELANARVVAETAPDYVIACCRLGIALQRAGWPEQVEAVLGRLSAEMYDLADRHPVVQAWLCLLRSELAGYAGDHGHRLDLTRQAVAAFERAGDLRRACLFRGNVGSAQMLLGDYERARRSLSASLEEASAMHLAGAVAMRLHLGITLARIGRIDEGKDCLMRALRVYIRSGDWAGECSARVYLAEILWMQGEHESAEREALAAVERAHISPVIQAEALGMLSMVQQDRPMESLMAASQAMELLQSVGGVADGEARIRLAYALALDALGHQESAAVAYAQGRDRLFQRAERISDEDWRISFLQCVPEHARAIALADARGTMS